MTAHDPMCPVLGVGYEAASFCYCERLRERDARVRADERERMKDDIWIMMAQQGITDGIRAEERERIVAELEGPARESEAMYAHAEAVAAKLVEVICERDERVGYWHRRWDFAQGQMDAMGASLLAARAQSAAAQAEARVAESEVRVLAAEVAALREQLERAPDGWEIVVAEKKGRREVLADLREQVLMLEHDDSCSEIRQEAPCDCLRGSVLALIEEADRG